MSEEITLKYPEDTFGQKIQVGDIILYAELGLYAGISFYEVLSLEEHGRPWEDYSTKLMSISLLPRCRGIGKGHKPKGKGRLLQYPNNCIIISGTDMLYTLRDQGYTV